MVGQVEYFVATAKRHSAHFSPNEHLEFFYINPPFLPIIVFYKIRLLKTIIQCNWVRIGGKLLNKYVLYLFVCSISQYILFINFSFQYSVKHGKSSLYLMATLISNYYFNSELIVHHLIYSKTRFWAKHNKIYTIHRRVIHNKNKSIENINMKT